jgi:hypothetical protein
MNIKDLAFLDWKKFKALKQENDPSPLLDKFDLASFHKQQILLDLVPK